MDLEKIIEDIAKKGVKTDAIFNHLWGNYSHPYNEQIAGVLNKHNIKWIDFKQQMARKFDVKETKKKDGEINFEWSLEQADAMKNFLEKVYSSQQNQEVTEDLEEEFFEEEEIEELPEEEFFEEEEIEELPEEEVSGEVVAEEEVDNSETVTPTSTKEQKSAPANAEKSEKAKKLEAKVNELCEKFKEEKNPLKVQVLKIKIKMLVAKLNREIELTNKKAEFEKRKADLTNNKNEEEKKNKKEAVILGREITKLKQEIRDNSMFDPESPEFVLPENFVRSKNGVEPAIDGIEEEDQKEIRDMIAKRNRLKELERKITRN